MSVESQAREDAREYARASMYYGEGAGVRRRLITSAVESRSARNPAYGRAFDKELERQDMSEHASAAVRERRLKDTAKKADKNVRGILSGNIKNVDTSFLVLVGLGYAAHQTGLDKVAYHKAKDQTQKLIRKYKMRKRTKPAPMRDGVYLITDVKEKTDVR